MKMGSVDPVEPQRSGTSRYFHAVLTLAFLGLTLATLQSRSATPVVLGRYSATLFAYQLWNIAGLGLLIAPARRGRVRVVGYLVVIASTFVAPINESVRHIPGIQAALPAVRLLAGLAMIAAEFDRYRGGRRPARGFALAAGVAVASLSVLDLALCGWVWCSSGFEEDYEGYRDLYDLGAVTPDDVVLVGDSFVWGHGVPKSRRFGNDLERLYAGEDRRVRVFSLGVRGAGLPRYIESLGRVPEGRKAGAVIVAFYPNDMPARPRPGSTLLRAFQDATWALGRSSLTFRACHDVAGRIEAPSLGHYHRSVVEDFQEDEPTFGRRWSELADALDRFARLAGRRSPGRPMLLILPLMVDYRTYPLTEAHDRLTKTAGALGYDVLDLLPDFRAELGDGRRFRVSPADNHFDARVHELVAGRIKRRLDARQDTSRLGLPKSDRARINRDRSPLRASPALPLRDRR